MKQWFKISELTNLQGLPSSVPGILKKAKKEHWMARYSLGLRVVEHA